MYFAPGATHAPHHVPKEWSDKYTWDIDLGQLSCEHMISPELRFRMAIGRH